MDTDELSTEAYQGIIIKAGKFNQDLELQFGLLASSCKNEKEYLAKAKYLITVIQKCEKAALSDMFFGQPPDKKKLHLTLEKILANISGVENIPENKRHYDF